MRITAVVALLVSVLGSVAGLFESSRCDAINDAVSFGVSLQQAMSNFGTFPDDCNYQQAFDSACSDAGLACYDYRNAPPSITFATADVAAITAYQQSVASYAECWGDDGAYRRTASCVDDTDFGAWKATLNSAQTDIEAVLQSSARDETANQALQSALSSVEEALTAIQRSMDGPKGQTSPGEPADLDGATVGTIVVASLIGVALIGGAIAVHLEL